MNFTMTFMKFIPWTRPSIAVPILEPPNGPCSFAFSELHLRRHVCFMRRLRVPYLCLCVVAM